MLILSGSLVITHRCFLLNPYFNISHKLNIESYGVNIYGILQYIIFIPTNDNIIIDRGFFQLTFHHFVNCHYLLNNNLSHGTLCFNWSDIYSHIRFSNGNIRIRNLYHLGHSNSDTFISLYEPLLYMSSPTKLQNLLSELLIDFVNTWHFDGQADKQFLTIFLHYRCGLWKRWLQSNGQKGRHVADDIFRCIFVNE